MNLYIQLYQCLIVDVIYQILRKNNGNIDGTSHKYPAYEEPKKP